MLEITKENEIIGIIKVNTKSQRKEKVQNVLVRFLILYLNTP